MSEFLEPNERDKPDALAESTAAEPDATTAEQHERPQGMLPGRERRRGVVERGFVRVIATGGIIGIATIPWRCACRPRLRWVDRGPCRRTDLGHLGRRALVIAAALARDRR